MRKVYLLSAALAISAYPSSYVAAEADERAEVLAVMDKAFAAILSRNPDDWDGIILPEGNVLSFRPHPDGEPGQLQMSLKSNAAQISGVESEGPELVERWTSDPVVMIRGPIAFAWGDYDFWIGGEFSHCGGTAVSFAKVDGSWKIANWAWTVEVDGCPTDPK